jgi:hypothetical protein
MNLSDYSDYETVLSRAKHYYGENIILKNQQEKQKSI